MAALYAAMGHCDCRHQGGGQPDHLHELGQLLLRIGTAWAQLVGWDGMGSFFSTAEPAAGCAGGATEITGAAGLEDGPSRPLLNGALLCVRADTVPLIPAPHLPATSSSTGGCPTRKSLQNCCWQGAASERPKGRPKNQGQTSQGRCFPQGRCGEAGPGVGTAREVYGSQPTRRWGPCWERAASTLGSRPSAARRLQVSHSQQHRELQA